MLKFTEILEIEEAKIKGGKVDSVTIAKEIEKAMFSFYGGPPGSSEYKQKFRKLMFNMKDPKNGDLREK